MNLERKAELYTACVVLGIVGLAAALLGLRAISEGESVSKFGIYVIGGIGVVIGMGTILWQASAPDV